jgi:hypothetical protein
MSAKKEKCPGSTHFVSPATKSASGVDVTGLEFGEELLENTLTL